MSVILSRPMGNTVTWQQREKKRQRARMHCIAERIFTSTASVMVESPSRADQLDRAPRKLTSPHYVPQLSSATSPSSAAAAAAYNPVPELDQCRAPQPPSRSFREQYYMQESSTFRPVSGAAGRLFGGGAAAEDHQEVRCPRCDSANTKFCYYNNYNLAQPRHFCRGCRRYWTKGGLLRNIPVGGGCRKPKRGQVAAASSDVVVVVDRNAKNARSGCTGPGSCTSPAAPTTSNTVGASSAAARSSRGGCATATGAGLSTIFATDGPPLPQPRPRPMFADQAAAFASFFVSPPPLPPISFSAQPKADDAVGLAPTLTLAEQPSSSASCTPDMTPLSARSGGTAMITSAAADWPPETATVIDAGMFDLAGDTSPYWNAASWTSTDPDGTMYLP